MSGVVWSHNGTVLFGVNFANGGQILDVANEAGDTIEGGERWRTAGGGFGLIFVGGRYKVEVKLRKNICVSDCE